MVVSLLGMTMGMPGEEPVAPGWQEAQDQVAALAAEDEKRNKAEQSSSQADSEPPPVAKLDLPEYSKKVVVRLHIFHKSSTSFYLIL